jgi:hypothetical protein
VNDYAGYERIKHVTRIATDDISRKCELCDFTVDGELEDATNHYMRQHDYAILHVNTEFAGRNGDGLAVRRHGVILGPMYQARVASEWTKARPRCYPLIEEVITLTA